MTTNCVEDVEGVEGVLSLSNINDGNYFSEDLSQFSMMDWYKLVKNTNYILTNDYVVDETISFITFTNYGYIIPYWYYYKKQHRF